MNQIQRRPLRAWTSAALIGVAWLTASPVLAQESKRKGVLDMANRDWPYLLVGLCGAILCFLALWFVAKVIRAACSGSGFDKPL
jgi:uncharacterized membrane protein YdcZ (DUF606 family)